MNRSVVLSGVMAVWIAASTGVLALGVGDKAPDIPVPATSGEDVNVGVADGSWKVVYFYPKSFTPGCTTEACGIRDSYAAFEELGVKVYGVSTDNIKKQNEFKAEHKLPFELLADDGKKLSEAFGVMGMLGMSKRVTFIVNPDGEITDVMDSVKVGTHDQDVIALLKTRLGK